MKELREVEVTYAPADDTVVPDLTALPGVLHVQAEPTIKQSAVYFDTADLTLLRAGVSLRRRAGGADEGWHLKVPVGGARDEFQRPLGRSVAAPPKALRDLVAGWARGAPLVPVATVETDRSTSLLLGPEYGILAEFTDDWVTGAAPDGRKVRWREWELELVSGTVDLLDAADRHLAALGVGRAEVSRKVARTLGDRLPAPQRLRTPKPGKPVSRLVHARLVEQVDLLARRDGDARRGLDVGVHKMRVACRRLRALLATFRPTLDRDVTDPLRQELRWLAGVLGQARDAAVVHQRLRDLVADEPRSQVRGPVLRRLRSTYRGRGKYELLAALHSQRYFDLRDRLDQLADDPPWTESADVPARDIVPKLLRKEFKRFRNRARDATHTGAVHEVSDKAQHKALHEELHQELHETRKAAKRLRYAAESVEPVAGKAARRLARDVRRATAHLGELQDTVVSRTDLLDLAKDAAAAGEPTFTYGRLHAREEAHAERLTATFRSRDVVGGVKGRTRSARKAARQK